MSVHVEVEVGIELCIRPEISSTSGHLVVVNILEVASLLWAASSLAVGSSSLVASLPAVEFLLCPYSLHLCYCTAGFAIDDGVDYGPVHMYL